jgi:hypothetical protein
MSRRFRTGTKVGRTIYRQVSDNPDDGEELVGMMDTRELAAFAAKAMNQALDRGTVPADETR